MSWVIFSGLSALCGSIFAVFLKLAAGHISRNLSTFIIYLSAALVSVIWFLASKYESGQVLFTSRGVLFSCLAGLVAASSAALAMRAFELGANLSVAEPFGRTLSVLAGVSLGLLLFGEQISVRVVFGVLFAIVGIYLLVGGK